ncbi:MAG: hypothetical protein K0S09_572 [Sphingobacteriaceae bacterium]|jgi:membrane-bound ClpP family serine protease|nr:hypothetical protein [Sphingobacteriaceae bacterium]
MRVLFQVFRVLIAIILVAKISNWFFHFNDETNRLLNAAMYCLIGIAYLAMGFIWDGKLFKLLIIACGLFLIVVNFVTPNTILNILGIVCILTPLLIARTYKESKSTEQDYSKS